jgi:putative DNA primase/helicase
LLQPIIGNIPAELRQYPQWVCWKAKSEKNGKIDKVPFDPKTGRAASSTDPATWGVFEQAVATSKNGGGYAGIGFVLNGGPYVGVDLDDCRNPETGDIQAWAWEIAQKLNTYTEISPSGKGLRMFLKGELKNPGRRKGKIECYVTGRFFTVTGHHVEGTPAAVMDRQQEILAFHESVFGKQKPPAKKQPPTQQATGLLSDDDIIARAKPGKDEVLARDIGLTSSRNSICVKPFLIRAILTFTVKHLLNTNYDSSLSIC